MTLAASVLVTEGWPAGFCPVHFGVPGAQCSDGCLVARHELAVIQNDYEQHWRIVAKTGWAT